MEGELITEPIEFDGGRGVTVYIPALPESERMLTDGVPPVLATCGSLDCFPLDERER